MKLKERLIKLREETKNKTESISKEDKEMIEQFNNYILGAEKIENLISNTDFFDQKFMHCTHFNDQKVYRYKLPNKKYKKELLGSPMIVDLMYKQLDTKKISTKTLSFLQKNNLNLEKYIDIEFFEYMNLEYSFDMSGALADLGEAVDIKDYREFRDLVAEEKFYFEKEKIHFKFAKCKNERGKDILVPLYIGIGTNDPLGFIEKDINGLKRWFKIDVEIDTPFQSKGILDLNSQKSSKLVFRSKNYDLLDFDFVDTTYNFEEETVIACALKKDTGELDLSKPSNLCEGFYKFKGIWINGVFSAERDIGKILPRYKEDTDIDVEKYIKNASVSVDDSKFLTNLSDCIDNEYVEFFNIKWHPFNILGSFGYDSLFTNLKNKHKSTHSQQELSELWHCCLENNVHTIIGDIERLKSYTERLKYANLIFRGLLESGRFFEILNEI